MNRARHEIYRNIHRVIRKRLFEVSVLLGRSEGHAELRELIEELEAHKAIEETFVHPLIEACEPSLLRDLDADHVTLDEAARALGRALDQIEAAPPEARRALADELYASFNLFVADQLRHLQREDREASAALWRHYDDAQLMAVTRNIVASQPPEVATVHILAMLEVVNPEERARLASMAPQI
jgi:hypothetical protein